MFRYFNDGHRVGFEFDKTKELIELHNNPEAVDHLTEIVNKINKTKIEEFNEMCQKNVKTTLDGYSGFIANSIKPINKEIKKANTISKVSIGLSSLAIISIGIDKGLDIYKKFKSKKISLKK